MTRHVRARLAQQDGFTLIELLATLLVLGILAGIVLTTFFGHKDRAEDGVAKANARTLVTQVESCFAVNEDYTVCDTVDELGPSEVPYGAGPGQASVTDADRLSYVLDSYSISEADGERHTFRIAKDLDTGTITQSCGPTGSGGCPESGTW